MFPLRDDQPLHSVSISTITIIALNVLVFFHQLTLDDYSLNAFISHWGLTATFRSFHVANIFTSMFIHGGWMHIIGNMIFLWCFGRSLEDAMGSGKFLVFYLMCGVAAALTQSFLTWGSRAPMVGASGAIAGVMGAYLLKFPRARILTLVVVIVFITRVEIPAVLILGYWFIVQLFSGAGSIGYSHLSQGGTAYFAHIGGFVAGMILVNVLGTQTRYYRRRDIYW
jgi:membrane associated rhomboid family serine protease